MMCVQGCVIKSGSAHLVKVVQGQRRGGLQREGQRGGAHRLLPTTQQLEGPPPLRIWPAGWNATNSLSRFRCSVCHMHAEDPATRWHSRRQAQHAACVEFSTVVSW